MTGSGRKRISKWDLKEAPHLLPGEHNDAGPGRPSNKEPQPRWRYGEGNYKEGRESLDASDFWDGDTTYGTKMSPGLDEWRQQKRNRSPESGRGRSYRSRSRSRSPERGFKRAGSNDSSGVQPCKDFVAGRCRRGDFYPHIHQDYKYSEDRKYLGSGLTDSWEGRHRRIDASKYFTSDDTRERTPRTGRSNDFSRRSANEVSRERESDRRDRVSSFEHNRTHESRRSGDIVCKFFAAGNCRNGKFCRFSHHGQTRDSSDNRTRNDWRQGVNSLDRMDSLKEGSRWSGTAVSDVANFSNWNEDRSGGLGVPEQRSISRSMDDSLATDNRFMVHHMDNDKAIENSERGYLQLTADNTGSGIGVTESRGADIRVTDMEISPAWDYRLPSSNHIVKEESRHTTEPSKFSLQDEVALQTCQQDIIRDVNQKDRTVAVMQPLISQTPYFQQNPSLDNDALNRFSCKNRNTIRYSALPHIDLNFSAYVPPGESLDQNGQGSTTVTQPHSGLNAIDKNQQIFAPYTPKDESFTYIGNPQPPQEGTSSKPDVLDTIKSDVISDNPSTQNIVSSEQFSNLTVSLAWLLESGKQLPEIYAALNGSKPMGFMQSSLSNSVGPADFPAPVSSQPKSAVGSQKQYDPVSGSMGLTKSESSNLPGEVVPNSSENKRFLSEKPEIQEQLPPCFPGGPSGVDLYRTDSINVDLNINIHQLSREDQNGNKGKENNTMKVEERIKGQDNGVLGKTEGDGSADENKKNNDGKAIRAFKFALAEFVKELLKPTWKEGQINKEAHKTIVKKVVDKVTGTIQGGHIPQSQEKVDSYLSSSKPKLSKLVQAYVEKIQKEKPAVT